MFDQRALAQTSQRLDAAVEQNDEIVTRATKHVLRRQVAVPTQRALQYPANWDLLANLGEQLAALPPQLVVLGCRALLEPQIVVPFNEPTVIGDTIQRTVALMSFGLDPTGNLWAVTIEVSTVTSGTGRFAPITAFDAEVAAVEPADIGYALEDQFLRTTSPVRALALEDARPALWLGGDRADETLPEVGPERIRAMLAARGYRAEVVQRPLRTWPSVKQRLDNDPPALALVWTPYATPADYAGIARGRFAVLDLDESDFDDALLLARLLLDELRDAETTSEPPDDWRTFEERLSELESGAFVITERARESIRATGYPDPSRMWLHLQRLARAANAFRADEGRVDSRLGDWMHERFEIEVALHDDNLSDGDKRFTHDGVEYSREPHVKVDDAKAWIEVGRIYFAVDAARIRLVVDHIGGKLY